MEHIGLFTKKTSECNQSRIFPQLLFIYKELFCLFWMICRYLMFWWWSSNRKVVKSEEEKNISNKHYQCWRGGWNVEFHYYDRRFFSQHRKWLFSWSQLQHHYIKNGFLVDHYYDNQNVEKNIKIKTFDVLIIPMAFWC